MRRSRAPLARWVTYVIMGRRARPAPRLRRFAALPMYARVAAVSGGASAVSHMILSADDCVPMLTRVDVRNLCLPRRRVPRAYLSAQQLSHLCAHLNCVSPTPRVAALSGAKSIAN